MSHAIIPRELTSPPYRMKATVPTPIPTSWSLHVLQSYNQQPNFGVNADSTMLTRVRPLGAGLALCQRCTPAVVERLLSGAAASASDHEDVPERFNSRTSECSRWAIGSAAGLGCSRVGPSCWWWVDGDCVPCPALAIASQQAPDHHLTSSTSSDRRAGQQAAILCRQQPALLRPAPAGTNRVPGAHGGHEREGEVPQAPPRLGVQQGARLCRPGSRLRGLVRSTGCGVEGAGLRLRDGVLDTAVVCSAGQRWQNMRSILEAMTCTSTSLRPPSHGILPPPLPPALTPTGGTADRAGR